MWWDLRAASLIESGSELPGLEVVELMVANGVEHWRPTLLQKMPHTAECGVRLGLFEVQSCFECMGARARVCVVTQRRCRQHELTQINCDCLVRKCLNFARQSRRQVIVRNPRLQNSTTPQRLPSGSTWPCTHLHS